MVKPAEERGGGHLLFPPAAAQNYYKDYTKDSDTKGRGYVDLRHCGLVVAAKTVVILHLHDKSM